MATTIFLFAMHTMHVKVGDMPWVSVEGIALSMGLSSLLWLACISAQLYGIYGSLKDSQRESSGEPKTPAGSTST